MQGFKHQVGSIKASLLLASLKRTSLCCHFLCTISHLGNKLCNMMIEKVLHEILTSNSHRGYPTGIYWLCTITIVGLYLRRIFAASTMHRGLFSSTYSMWLQDASGRSPSHSLSNFNTAVICRDALPSAQVSSSNLVREYFPEPWMILDGHLHGSPRLIFLQKRIRISIGGAWLATGALAAPKSPGQPAW